MLLALQVLGQKERESIEQYRVKSTYKPPVIETGDSGTGTVLVKHSVSPDSIGVFYRQDMRLAHLVDLHKRTNASTVEGKGFRIQIYAGSKMEVANEAKTDFLQAFRESGMEVYKDWNPPHFWVRVGDFLTRNEAMRHLGQVKTVFPDAFVVADKINLPKYKKLTAHNPSPKSPEPEGQED